jgi:hypothetical protein
MLKMIGSARVWSFKTVFFRYFFCVLGNPERGRGLIRATQEASGSLVNTTIPVSFLDFLLLQIIA